MLVSRRCLISVAAASAARASPAAPAADACRLPRRWDQTWDVIVIGAGGAGLTAGIFAVQGGARTIVLEKAAFPGGNTMISGGGFNAAVEEDARAIGITDSPELHARQTLEAGDYRADAEVVGMLTASAPETLRWLKEIGVRFHPRVYQIYGGLYPRCHNPAGQRGSDYIRAEIDLAGRIGLEILTGHKVTAVIRESPDAGRVLGVEVEIAGRRQHWRARRGVVAAAGGFAANAGMCAFFDPRIRDVSTTNMPSATGEVLLALQDIGAMATGLDYIQCIMGPAPGYRASANVHQEVEYCIFINREGKRFVAEDQRRDVLRDATLQQGDGTIFGITDQDGRAANDKYQTDRNDRALARGYLFRAGTLRELADIIGVPPEALEETVAEFNRSCETGIDRFGRAARMMTRRIEKPPFYAAPLGVSRHHTMGGVRINTRAEVLDRRGRIIPGLFAAGEVTGGIHGSNRVGGNAIADAFTYGRIAGCNAAARPAAK